MKENITITMGMDLQALRKAMDQATALVSKTIAGMKKAFLALAGVMGVAFGFRAIADGIGAAVRRGKELDMLARETGRTADEIAVFTEQVHRSELSMDEAAGVLETWAENLRDAQLGATGLGAKLQYLGLAEDALVGKSMPEQFDLVATAINNIKDPVTRAKLAMDMFGSAGKKAVANYQRGDLAEASRLFGKNAKSLADASRQMALVDDAWKRIKRAGEVVFGAIASKVAPVLQAAADKLMEILPKIEAIGAKIGAGIIDAMAIVIGLLEGGNLGEALKLSFEVAARWLADFLLQTFAFIGNFLMKAFGAAVKILGDGNLWKGLLKVFASIGLLLVDAFKVIGEFMGNADFWSGMKDAMLSLTVAFGAGLIEAALLFNKWLSTGTMSVLKAIIGVMQYVVPGAAGAMKALDLVNQTMQKAGGGDVVKNAKQYASDKAAEKTDPMARAGEALQSAMQDLAAVDFAPFKQLLLDVPNIWKMSAADLFKDPELLKRLQTIIEQARKQGMAWLGGQKKPDLRPGESPMARPFRPGVANNVFDDFRRVGGGIAGGVSNVQERMVTKLEEIARLHAETNTLLKPDSGGRKMGDRNMMGLELGYIQ